MEGSELMYSLLVEGLGGLGKHAYVKPEDWHTQM